ncbi:MAG: nucleoside triphosphate pyrophosphohydrolase [Acidobacteriota bacterium]
MSRAQLNDLAVLMGRLRSADGCPWDRVQTLESLKRYLLEETYEVLDALDSGDVAAHREELGDLLFQIVFQAHLRQEEDSFSLEDVITGIHQKLVRRHPHVFGKATAHTPEEVLKQWERLKAEEKRGTHRPSLIDHVPRELPGLLRALRLTEKAAQVGFDWTDDEDLNAKCEEEWAELKEALAAGRREKIMEELGDLLFTLANLARRQGLDPDESLRQANRKFERRFRYVEAGVQKRGRSIGEASLEEMNALWEEAKEGEAGRSS